ncbi:hypothetical protein [Iningainema tapete]|uniref:Uncharacterized protein n=1 Tax=Iningainema tapete BLCC-T55 TaxID=2748662 RepID=A0A8J7BWV0_9CYAN|nr:hypothetical protein [Iningainema tapete]MBD2772502.1 hypothetical protein [Iningainema tapete BLCC-T55]
MPNATLKLRVNFWIWNFTISDQLGHLLFSIRLFILKLLIILNKAIIDKKDTSFTKKNEDVKPIEVLKNAMLSTNVITLLMKGIMSGAITIRGKGQIKASLILPRHTAI